MSRLISVIVPIYNVEEYLSRCIDSIINQTYAELEIILVDDGSTDKCGIICEEYAQKDARIKVLHKQNGGLSDARNVGLENAQGDYIAFVDSDDYIALDMYEKLYRRIEKDKSDLAICNIEFVNEKKEPLIRNTLDAGDCVINEKQFWYELYGKNYTYCVVAWNKLYKKEIFEEIRYEYGKYHEDEFIIHKVISQCEKISFLSEKCYFYLQRNNSIMNEGFSIRRLDGAEAGIERSLYFYNKKWQNLAELALIRSIGFIMKGYNSPNYNEIIWKNRVKELHGLFRKSYIKISKSKNATLRFRINGLTFYISPVVYKILHTIKS